MTNKELQEHLKKFDDDLEVIIEEMGTKNQFIPKSLTVFFCEDGKLFIDAIFNSEGL